MCPPRRLSMLLSLVLLATAALPTRATEKPRLTIEAPGIRVQTGNRVAIYAFPPPGFDPRRADGPWPYPYPPYPSAHPAFAPTPGYPTYGTPAPYVPPGGPYLPPPVEAREIEVKPAGRLVIEVNPPDADVYVDGMRLTARGERGFVIGLLAGRHRVDVRRAGKQRWSQDVEVPAGGGLLITVELADQAGTADPGSSAHQETKEKEP